MATELSLSTMMFIDTSKCIGCKACQVSCKQWHQLPVEPTTFTGSYQNPPNVSRDTFTMVKFTEFEREGKLKWLFFKNQCRHCLRPKCQRACPKGIKRTKEGFIVFNENCIPANLKAPYKALDDAKPDAEKNLGGACPFNVPRYNPDLGRYVKCDFCFDRLDSLNAGKYASTYRDGCATTACELTCPPQAIITGTVGTITPIAKKRFNKVKKNLPYASLYWGKYGRTQVLYLLAEAPASYGL